MMVRSMLAALPKAAPGFQAIDPEAAPRPQQAAPAGAPMTSVQMLVALAAADPAIERRRKLAVDAERGLKALETLHRELVAGIPGPERLREIADWSQTLEMPDEPVLAGILRDIDVRVRVELAKLDIEI